LFAWLLVSLALSRLAPGQEGREPSELESAAQQFVEQLSGDQFAAAAERFDATMARLMPAEKLAELWRELSASVGPFQEQIDLRTTKLGAYDIVFVTCQFERSKLDVKVVFDREKRIAGLFFVPPQAQAEYQPPPYANPESFREVEVTIGSPPWELPGTLTLPESAERVSAVVLLHGSGPNDRDETIYANKPFKDLAWGLASRGIAVLRYDKRTLTHNKRMAELTELTVADEVIDDAFSAVRLLRMRPEIAPDRIYMVGHSLGGYLAPRITSQDTDRMIAGFVIMAGNTRPVADLLWDQTNYILGLDGSLSAKDEKKLTELKGELDRLRAIADSAELGSEPLLGATVSYWRDLDRYDPAAVAATLDRPLLILQGERDYQVTMDDYRGWQGALSARNDVVFMSYPALNHLFMPGEGPGKPAEYEVTANVAEAVVADIADWLKRQAVSFGTDASSHKSK
jgi:hypothetical protein